MEQREWLALGVIGGVTLLLSAPAPGISHPILVLLFAYLFTRILHRFTSSSG